MCMEDVRAYRKTSVKHTQIITAGGTPIMLPQNEKRVAIIISAFPSTAGITFGPSAAFAANGLTMPSSGSPTVYDLQKIGRFVCQQLFYNDPGGPGNFINISEIILEET